MTSSALPFVSNTLNEFLASRPGGTLLRRPASQVLAQTVPPPPPRAPTPDADKHAALQRKFDTFSMRDKGVLAQLASELLRELRPDMYERAGGVLVLLGIDLYCELLVQVGILHQAGDSLHLTRQRVEKEVHLLRSRIIDAEDRAMSMLLQMVNEQVAAEATRLEGLMEETLAEERELMSGAAERAQADATAERRRADQLQALLDQRGAQAATEEAKLRATLSRERDATVARERAWNEERRRLQADLKNAQALVGHLNQELEARDQAVLVTPAPAPQRVTLASHLEAHSLRAYLLAQGHGAGTVSHQTLHLEAGIPDVAVQAWRAAYPTPAAQVAQLRQAVAA
ncbi:hypothetical protein [Deinococcus multiflagellatus]|uniref:Uncharacterized protein n=1 Tax=Deinococcus multiflagellatus TaxID=1656887 RepID=A0ABW1ZTP5_9DEIO|nr:hypothetical protein [Deinococcus multiflagellatus]MBZ9715356.1 hypothetical protein [Deinococcus multiflagellatus]